MKVEMKKTQKRWHSFVSAPPVALRSFLLGLLLLVGPANVAAQTCAAVTVGGPEGATDAMRPFDTTATIVDTEQVSWDAGRRMWITPGNNRNLVAQWVEVRFSEPVPAGNIALDIIDVDTDGGTVDFQILGGTATTRDYFLVSGAQWFSYDPSTGRTTKTARGGNDLGFRLGSNEPARTISGFRFTVRARDNVGIALWTQATCVTLRKISQGATGTFSFTQTNLIDANSVTQPTARLTTTAEGTAVSAATGFVEDRRNPVVFSETLPAGMRALSASCIDLNNANNINPPTAFGSLSGSVLTVPAANLLPLANLVCTYTNVVPAKLRVQKVFLGSRVADTDQVALSIAQGATSRGTGTTTGAGSAVTSPAVEYLDADPGVAYTLSETAAGTMNLANFNSTYSCTNARAGGQTPSGTGSSFSITPAAADDLACTITNTRRTATVQIRKTWSGAEVGNAVRITGTGLATLQSTANTASETDSGPVETVGAGSVIAFAETFTSGNPEHYNGTLACTGTSGLAGNTLTVGPDDTAIVCTYSNTRRTATLQLRKTWANAQVGNSVDVTATDVSAGTRVTLSTLSSTAGAADETDSGTAVTVNAGSVISLAETFTNGDAANYTSSLACTGTAGLSGSTLTVAGGDTAIVCTYTNAQRTATFQLRKSWSGATVGDAVNIAGRDPVTGTTVTPLASTADTATEIDSGNAQSVRAGQIIELTEAFTRGDTAHYTSDLACTGASDFDPAARRITVRPADASIVCTYTNTHRTATVQLRKAWSGALAGDAVTVTATGLSPLASTADAATEVDSGMAQAVPTGTVITLAEAFTTGDSANYTSSLACTGTSGLAGNTLTVGANDTAIVCTYANTRRTATVQIRKTWSGAEVGNAVRITGTGLATLQSTANTASETDSGPVETVGAGSVIAFAETFTSGNTEHYNGTLACTGTSGLSGNTLTVGPNDTAIVCTYSNTRRTATLQLRKTWANAQAGNSVDVTATDVSAGTRVTLSTLSSTAGAADETDSGTAVTVNAGSVISLAETFTNGDAANYTSSLACTGTAGLSGSTLTVAGGDTAIVCTYTNAQRTATFQLRKSWSGATVGDAVNITGRDPVTGTTVTPLASTADTATEIDSGNAQSVRAGQIIDLTEAFTRGDTAYYTSDLTCTGASDFNPAARRVTVRPADAAIVCTYTNAWRVSEVKYAKAADTAGPVAVGDTITYTLTATVGNSPTRAAIKLTDTLGTGLTFGAVTDDGIFTCGNNASMLTCTLPAGTLPGTYVVTYTATVNAQASGTVENAVAGAGDDPGNPLLTCAGTCRTSTPVAAPRVGYGKTADRASPVRVGDTITYTLTSTVSNSQTTALTTLTDTLGTGLTFGAVADASAFTCRNADNVLSCTLPTGTVPGTYTVRYTATVDDKAIGTVANAVVGKSDDPNGATPICTTGTCRIETPLAASQMGYTKTADTVGPVSVGDTITYTLVATVRNSQTPAAIALTDTLGKGLTFAAVVDASVFTCADSGSTLTCTLPAGTVPGAYRVTYTATVNAEAISTVDNAVTGVSADPNDPSPPTCTDTCRTTTPVALPRVTYAKTVDAAGPAGVGDTLTYTLTSIVSDSQTTAPVTLTDTLGAGLDFLAVTQAGKYTCSNSGNTLTCTLPIGTKPGTYAATYTARVNAHASGTVDNAVKATGSEPSLPVTCDPGCNTSTPIKPPRVTVSKTADPANGTDVEVDQVIQYTLTVTVSDAATLAQVDLVDTPGQGLTLGSLPKGCTYDKATITCVLPAGTPAGTHTFTYAATVNDEAEEFVRNRVTANHMQVASDTRQQAPECIACTTQHPVASSDVRISKSVAVRQVRIGDLVRYTLTVQNVGRGWVRGATVVDTAPAGFTYVEGSLRAKDADNQIGVAGQHPVRFTGIDIRGGESATLVYLMRVGAGVRPGTQTNTAEVFDHRGMAVSRKSNASVELLGDPQVENALIFGTVFNDCDGDGWQDEGESGIPGVRIASVDGLLMETDRYGRYHLAGVPGGASPRGRNFILKVDPSTLPDDATFTTDNPLLRRITPGLPVRFDWGVRRCVTEMHEAPSPQNVPNVHLDNDGDPIAPIDDIQH